MGAAGVGVSALLTYAENDIGLYLKAKPYLKRAAVLLDVGPGVRPQRFVKCDRMICLEPHAEYCDILLDAGLETIRGEAPAGLVGLEPVDTVTAIDVIEHLTREAGLWTIAEMKNLAQSQVVIFTPLGFMPQDGGEKTDAWGYQGQHWQEHRSGWTPDDFPGWRCFVDEHFHNRDGQDFGAFFAIWDRKQ